MFHWKSVAASVAALLLAGCAAVGVVETSDPEAKLGDADDLFVHQDRSIPAEKLILQAIDIYEKRGDPHGMGMAFQEYALLLRSDSVKRREKTYRRDGFFDKSIMFDRRLEKADEFDRKAISYFQESATRHRTAEAFDSLTNDYYFMSLVEWRLNDKERACGSVNKMVEAYEENIRRNPAANPAGNVPKMTANLRQHYGCK